MFPDGKSLVAELQPLKSKILKLAKSSSAAATILHELQDDSSEGTVILLSLLRLLIFWVSPCIVSNPIFVMHELLQVTVI